MSASTTNGENPNQSSFGQTVLTLTFTGKPFPDIKALMPKKLNHPDHYTKPTIEELAAKERVEPGYCGRVNDFIFGRTGIASVKFLGETDVRGVDLESCIQFFEDKVILKRAKWPPVDQGFNNNTAEIKLLKSQLWWLAMDRSDTQTLVFRKYKNYKKINGDRIINGYTTFQVKYINESGVIQFIPNASLALRIKRWIMRMLKGFFQ